MSATLRPRHTARARQSSFSLFSRARHAIRRSLLWKTIGGGVAGIVAVALVVTGASLGAVAAGSDGPTPYTVTAQGVTLPTGVTFPSSGHVNYKATNLDGTGEVSFGVQFDPNNGQPGGHFIGLSYFPFSNVASDGTHGAVTTSAASTFPGGYCITWVQLSDYNEHFGEGGQKPVCTGTSVPVAVSAVATASAQTCVADALVGGSIAVTGDLTHVAFTIGSDVITKTGTYSYAPGDYAVKVTPNAGYRLEDGVAGAYTLTVAGFAGDCLKQVSIDTDPTASSCTNLTDGTNFTSWISIQLDKGVVYKIDGTVVTSQYTQVTPDVVHHVTAEAAAGFTLAGTHAHEWDLIATDTADSCIATGGTATPAVTHTAATCSAAGSYTLGVEEPELVSDILWTVNGESAVAGTFTAPTGTTLHIVATAVAGSGISGSETGSQEWTITIPASSAPCDLTTLAFTGVGSETSTLLIVALLLMLAGAGVFTASRLRSRAS